MNNNNNFIKIKFEGIELDVRPNEEHEWLLETLLVAKGYQVEKQTIKKHLTRNSSEFIEGKHYFREVQNVPTSESKIFWTKRGVIRLGFLIKGERARKFRNWAEDFILSNQNRAIKIPTQLETAKMLVAALETLEEKEKVIAELAPKAEYTDTVLRSTTDITTTLIAKELGVTTQRLNSELYKLGVQYKVGDTWVLYAKYANKGYADYYTFSYVTHTNEVKTRQQLVWTEVGRQFIHLLIKGRL